MVAQAAKAKLIWFLVLIALLIASTTSSCGRPFKYAVRVQEEGTGDNIANANVLIYPDDGKAPLCSITDAHGFTRISLDVAYKGHEALLVVEATGYAKHTQGIDFTEGNLSQVVQLRPESPSPTPTPTPTQTPSPIPTSTATVTQPPSPTATPTPSPTCTMTPPPTFTPTPTLSPTPASPALATAIQGSSIFAEPDANSQVLGSVRAGESVPVLGRSRYGKWFYVRAGQGLEGFVYAPRFDWKGSYDSLPVKESGDATTPVTTPSTTLTPYPPLEIQLWDIAGTEQCSDAMWSKLVYINGRGGDGVYTYYWNDELLAGPTNGSYTHKMHTTGGAIVGTGKVVSGDGQVAGKELWITVPACAQ